jgi:hypothetical protein
VVITADSSGAGNWSLIETAYAEACAVQAGVEDLSVVSMKRPRENLSGLYALIGE